PLPIGTTGGLFTHQLGSSTPLFGDLFDDNDALWLEVEADGAIITPRTRLISAPYARSAQDVEASWGGNDSVYARTRNDFCGFSTYSVFDGVERIRLWGCSYGEVLLNDGSGATNAMLGGPPSGGYLSLLNGPGASFLDAGSSGDASANFSTDAINADEMLNEPGIASTFKNTIIGMPTAATNFDTVPITVPTAGYIVVNAYGFVDLLHVSGTSTIIRFTVSKTAGVMDFDNFSYHGQTPGAPSGTYLTAFSITKVEAVAAGTHTYYLVGDEFSGNGNIGRPRMTAMFFPTNYGTVVSTKPVLTRVGGNVAAFTDAVGIGQAGEVQVITVEDSKARLEAERAKQLADMEARLKKLEEAAKTGKQQIVDDNR
ncbi:MAG TPA: hypothetical protein VFR89_08080, partial [candidate division Zixibacteria bacterium]|nr:hypothetical protein [candidate division Zixibacteria bacterium]